MFTTVFSGVTVFVLGQFILKLFLEPIIAFKEVKGELTHFFLFHHARITNARGTQELRNEVKRMSAQILAKKEAILGYKLLSWSFSLPREQAVVDACKALNCIAYLLMEGSQQDAGQRGGQATKIQQAMMEIQQKLRIRVSYK